MWETLSSYDTKLFSHASPTKKRETLKILILIEICERENILFLNVNFLQSSFEL